MVEGNQREQAARGMMSAGVRSLSGPGQPANLRDPNPHDRDPLDGHYRMNNRTNQFVQERNGKTVNDSTSNFWTADNPQTGTRYTTTDVDTPTWSYERNTYPSGFGQERYNGGDFTDFMMKGGGQDYDGRMDQGSGLGSFFGEDEFEDETQEEFVARVEGMERDRSNEDLYFTEFEDDVVQVMPGEIRPPQFSGSVGTQIRPWDYDDSMTFGNFYRGGILSL
jgi:hypothetical protein|tara:strand:+ start:3526 stop:4191 length:666 start_codon:yes stop_codon:yes gene_type:complete